MNLFGMMETSGGAMQAERMRAEVVAANMANAETTRTASGGPYRRQQVVFAANQGDPGFLDSMTAASGSGTREQRSTWPRQRCPRLSLPGSANRGAGRAYRAGGRGLRRRRSSATIPGIPTPGRMDMSRIRTLIRSQRWWT